MQGLPGNTYVLLRSVAKACLLFALTFSCSAVGIDFQVRFLTFTGIVTNRSFNTVNGPADRQRLLTGLQLVPSGADGIYMAVDRSAILRVTAAGDEIPESSALTEINDWPMGITYDSQANRTVLVTLGGEGFLFQRTPDGEWSMLASMNNQDLADLVYRPEDNSFYGIRVYNGAPTVPATLLKYSATGVKLDEISLPGFAVNIGPGQKTAKLVAAEGKIIALVEVPPEQTLTAEDHSRIYVIDPVAGTSELTYTGQSAPRVWFEAPDNNANIPEGQNVTIKIDAFDPDNDLRRIDLMDGSLLLHNWSFDQSLAGTNKVVFQWTPTSGIHTLTARASDYREAISDAEITVNIGASNALTFSASYFKDNNAVTVQYRETGPTDGGTLFRGAMLSPPANLYYYLGHQGQTVFRWYSKLGTYTETSPGDANFSWPRGAAYDSKRGVFLVVTLGGEGFLYTVTPDTLAWATVGSMNNVDVDSMVYHLADDHLYMVQNLHDSGILRVLRYTIDGHPAGTIDVANVPFDIGGAYTSQLVSVGDRIALLVEPTPGWTQMQSAESRIYIIDPVQNTAALTYRKQWDQWPPVTPPQLGIKITSPVEGASIVRGVPIHFTAEAQNGSFVGATFTVDGKVGAQGVPSPVAVVPQTFTYVWTNGLPGDHTVTSRAFTAAGSNIFSAPVHFTITPATNWPVIRFVSPSTNAFIHVGDHVSVVLEVSDPDNNVVFLMFDNAKPLQRMTFDPPPTGTNRYTFDWVPTFADRITLYASARDGAGLSSYASLLLTVYDSVQFVQRDLPDYYSAGNWLNVKLIAQPGTNVNAWAVEEQPPTGWQFGQASDGGSFDNVTGKIKWGPFLDSAARTLLYTIYAPTNSRGTKTFTGITSANGLSKAIVGETNITDVMPYHPADAPPQDYRITANELTAYAAAWKTKTPWPRGPATIPIEYVTRAGQIWKLGEHYEFSSILRPPLCWVPVNRQTLLAALSAPSEAIRTLPPAFSPGHAVTVSVNVRPAADVQAYALEERPPAGWSIAAAGDGSIVEGAVRFGPFFDAQERTFTYQVIPLSASAAEFAGDVSFNGSKLVVDGANILRPPSGIAESRDGHIYLRFNATPGESFILESADAVDSATWQFETTIQGTDSSVALPPIEPSATQKFYRLQPVAP